MKIAEFELERYFAKYEFNTKYLLSSSDIEAMSVDELLKLDENNYDSNLTSLKNTWLGYTEAPGALELRTEVAKLYENINAESVLMHAGAEEAIMNFMFSILAPEDHVIVMYPCYQSLISLAEAKGCEVTKWLLDEDKAWELDFNFLEDSIKAKTKAIVINCPHNPTGYLISREQQQKLIEIARKNNLYIFSDEVYRLSEFDENDRLANACDLYENAVSLGVMSKSFGLAGLRIGWVATQNKEVYKKMASFKDYSSICNSAPSETLSLIALQNKEKLLTRNLNILKTNLDIADKFFEKYSGNFSWIKPKAGTIAFPKYQGSISTDELCRKMVTEYEAMLLPGAVYLDASDNDRKLLSLKNNFRLGYGRKSFTESLGKFEVCLRSLK
ncbi:MAG: aminotransferase class I/II-fold pyridoxal phosphate-dependent enzyme [Candidatus Caenarcaniphilales bacterium]|nr:aminotransferase class I/II-fold pyridoxal phosphate-dependent enzyme [Candidatus Caenarcaniphilales bacterium]